MKNPIKYLLALLVISCSAPKVYIPSGYETKPLFEGEKEMDVTDYSIREAGDLADEFPDENMINEKVSVTIDFKFNDKYDSSLYYKQYLAENRKADSIAKKKKKSFSKNPELTERPVPDGQVFMNTAYEYEYRTIKDFVEEPIVLHYNSMVSIKDFYAKIDNNTATLEKRDESYENDMYFKTDSRYKIYDLNIPVRGSLINYKYTEECRDAIFNSVLYITEGHFTQKKVVKIAMPNFLSFDIIEKNFEGVSYTRDTIMEYPKNNSSGEKTKYVVYTFKRIKSFENSHSDRGPSYNYPMLYFHFKTASDNGKTHPIMRNTDDLYRWYRLVSSSMTNDTSAFASFTKNLVKDKKTDEEKIKTVYYWIQDNIHYIAFEDGIAGFRADECSDVYNKRYGDCKGMANLTKNMLKVLGYDARMVWIGTKHQNFSYDIPGLPVDNHAICAVKIKGKFIFLDGTENFCALNEYANRIQGRKCIVENGDAYIIETIPEWGYEHNEQNTIETIDIDGNKLQVKAKRSFKGESKLSFIRSFNYLSSEDRQESLFNYLTDDNVDFTVSNVVTTDLKNRDINPELSYQLIIKNQVLNANGKTMVNLDWDREFDGVSFDSTRNVDVDLDYKNYDKRQATLNLKPGQKATGLPAPINIENDYYMFKLEMRQVGNTVVYTKTLITKKDYLPVSMIKTFEADCKKLSAFYNTYITIQ